MKLNASQRAVLARLDDVASGASISAFYAGRALARAKLFVPKAQPHTHASTVEAGLRVLRSLLKKGLALSVNEADGAKWYATPLGLRTKTPIDKAALSLTRYCRRRGFYVTVVHGVDAYGRECLYRYGIVRGENDLTVWCGYPVYRRRGIKPA